MEGNFADPDYLRKLGIPDSVFSPSMSLSDKQAQAILEMRLQRLTGLEREKIIPEYTELLRFIARLKEILGSEAEILKIIVGELTELKEKFGDERRTEIVDQTADISLEDTIVEEDVVVTVSHTGYIKRTAVSMYRAQRRGGKGKSGMKTKDEDFVEHLFVASSKDFMMFFTDTGRVYVLKVYEIPEGGRATRGKAIVNLLNLQAGEKIAAILSVEVLRRRPQPDHGNPSGGGEEEPDQGIRQHQDRRNHRRQPG